MTDRQIQVLLEQEEGYRFVASYGDQTPDLLIDEPPPLGHSAGPSPVQLLVTAVASCLTDSLVFALGKFRQPTDGIGTQAIAYVGRNAENRLRVSRIEARLQLGRPATAYLHLERILGQFEQFCTVTQSVAQGLPVELTVVDSSGAVLKAPDHAG
ncbi:OsmC family protein [Pseudomonas sp.]|uniref:OsmC family protein n=1 Tax=Pseudomonas sp. TaxID=306 RepID=UPI00272ABEA8|nr:OsmC family protein [Pseudomonas sp.]